MIRESLAEKVILKADLNRRKESKSARHFGKEHFKWREQLQKVSREARD